MGVGALRTAGVKSDTAVTAANCFWDGVRRTLLGFASTIEA